MRARYRWLDHIIRANESFTRNHGNHYAAAITYFSVLSLIPILMVAFAIAGYVLAGNHALLAQLQTGITKSVPGSLGDTLNQAVGQAIKSRNTVGVIGLLVALYSGVGWMSNLREALTAQWDQQPVKGSFVKTLVLDLIALVGLGLALVVSFAITIAGTALGTLLLKLVGLEHNSWAHVLLVVATVVLSIGANWLVFLWVIARLPRERVGLRSALRGALAAAVGFEILKQLATVLLRSTSSSPTGAVFGSVISLLVFANLVSRFLLMVTAWTATARENQRARPVPVPAPAVIRPIVQNRTGLGPVAAAGLVAAGALTGHFLGRRPR
ncbi:MAG TPA: inner membrane protein YhjD [Pseudonocardiaceae bacterium]|nr:inner membrane protein YhjD [Pseudonocardiaceae bacterium]